MHILVVNSHPDRSEVHIYAALRAQGLNVEVVCDPSALLVKELRTHEVPVLNLHFRARIDLVAVRVLRDKILSGSFDLIHAVSKRALTHTMIALVGIDVPVVAYRGIIGNLSRWNPEISLTYFSRKVKHIICVCEAVQHYLLSVGTSAEKAVTIHKGHHISWYQPADRQSFSEFGIPEEAFVVGCAAKMRCRKGIDVLIRAASSRPELNIHLLLAGEIADQSIPALVRLLQLESRVHLIGYRMDAAGLMGACDCFVMPSLRREGLPRAVIEAMAQGVPAVITKVGGMPEIVEHGVSGILVPPNDADSLAEAIRVLALDKSFRDRMGVQAKTRIATHFNVDQTVQSYRRIFEATAFLNRKRGVS